MAGLDQLDPLLQSLQALKPPGASKGKISAITQLCLENIQSDTIIAQKLFSHFKRTPATHKLGVLFVVDSVTRQWLDKDRHAPGSAADDGTFASGVRKMTELMPSLMQNLLEAAPSEQRVKILSLVAIWERGNTFPPKMLADFKQKIENPTPFVASSTPPGSPPQKLLSSLGIRQTPKQQASQQPAPPAPAQADASSILAALAGLSRPVQPAALPPPPPPLAAPSQDLSALLASVGQQTQVLPPAPTPQNFNPYPAQALPPQFSAPPPSHTNFPPQFGGFVPPPVPQQPAYVQPPAPQPPVQNAAAAITSILPPHILNNPESFAQVLKIFQDLTAQGVPQDQWAPVLAALYPQDAAPAAASAPSWQPPQAQNGYQNGGGAYASFQNGAAEQARHRDRSRSPDYRRDRGAATNRRASPVYGVYDAAATANSDSFNDDSDRRGRRQGGRNFRQRTPPAARNGQHEGSAPPGGIRPKWTDIDPSVPQGHIKVLSRTLFVGGATGSESEIRAIFSRFGQVQTCIVNHDKRHAFVKMCNRTDAVNARAGMENMRDPESLSKARQTKWGVGFGPRECCDYSSGVSTIPIDTLTEADHKWVLTAEFGGTGGRPIESGLVFEEPDIEIGAGVSSKAMSRRVLPDTGSKRGRGGGGGGGGGRYRQPEQRRESPRPEPALVQPPPPVPNFGFQFAMPGSMPYQ